jgi:hypothetical protein
MFACYPILERVGIDLGEYALICSLGIALSSTLLLGFFGRLRLKGWFGSASASQLSSERLAFQKERSNEQSQFKQ